MSRRWKIILGIIGGLAVAVAALWVWPFGRLILTGGLAYLKDRPFNHLEWKAVEDAEPVEQRIRLMMVEDLVKNHKVKGRDSLSVKEMLGEPDRQYGFSYSLGSLAEDMEQFFLIVDFDSTGHVASFSIKEKKGEDDTSSTVKIELKY